MCKDNQTEGYFSVLQRAVREAPTVLVGIGREWDGKVPEEERGKAYSALARLLRWTNYFIVTMNTDDRIYDSGLDAAHIVAPFGSIHRYQCEDGCEGKIWREEELPAERVCPHCGKPLIPNTKDAEHYLEEGYLPQWQAYTDWLTHTLNQKMTILELGVDFDMPSVIRWPFERIVILNQKARLYRVHERWHQLSEEVNESGRGFSVAGNSCALFAAAEEAELAVKKAEPTAQTKEEAGGNCDGSNQQ